MADNVGTGARESGAPRHRLQRADLRRVWARVVGVLINVVRWAGALGAALLAFHVVLTVGGANPDNGIAQFVTTWSKPLALGFENLFVPDDPKLAVLLNYGLAAVFWLIATSLATKILRALT